MHEAAQTPYIHGETVRLSVNYLGSNVARRADSFASLFVLVGKFDRASKVSYAKVVKNT